MSRNELYDVLNTIRNIKEDTYICSDNPEDLNYLNLSYVEAQLLKYLLESQLKKLSTQNEDDKLIVDNKFKLDRLVKLFEKIKTLVVTLIKEINTYIYNTIIKYITERKSIILPNDSTEKELIEYYKNNIERLHRENQLNDGQFQNIKYFLELYNNNYHITKISYYDIRNFFKKKTLTEIIKYFNNRNIYEIRPIYNIKVTLIYVYYIFNEIINKINNRIEIDVKNICVNGITVPDKQNIIQHRKCIMNDYQINDKLDENIKLMLSNLNLDINLNA